MIDSKKTLAHLKDHLRALTITVGERSVRFPENLEKAAAYIESVFQDMGLRAGRESYAYRNLSVANVVAEISFGATPSRHYLLGAHYDSVAGTVGADDNASAVAVQLEVARNLKLLERREDLDLKIKFVSFALEERPVFITPYMGSKVYARKAKREKEKIDGMICLEMVGYTCRESGCQGYPFPLNFMDYPKKGDFIGIVGDIGSRKFALNLYNAFQKNPSLPVVKLLVPFKGWLLPNVRLSDHSSFWDQGYNAVMVTDSAFYRNPHYHLPSDTMEKLDYEFMAEVVKSLVIFFQSRSADYKEISLFSHLK
jgi:Zn-dependent M28 family amino/carboxypeptidase